MLKKKRLSGNGVEVTFSMPPIDGAVELYLCGEFNKWHRSGAPLAQQPDGSWATTLILDGGRSYRFRYLDNQGRWHNDWEADAYVPNEFGSEDSVVDLFAFDKKMSHVAEKPSPQRRPAQKKPAAKKRPPGPASRPHRGPPRGGKRRPPR